MPNHSIFRRAAIFLCASAMAAGASAQWVPIGPETVLTDVDQPLEFFNVQVAPGDDGEFIALWLEFDQGPLQGTQVGRRFDVTNQPVGESFVTGQVDYFTGQQSLAVSEDGDFVVSWTYGYSDPCPPGTGPDCDFFAAYGRLFDSSDAPAGEPIRFTDGPGGEQRTDEGRDPKAAFGPDGGFSVVWVDDLDQQIRARPYDSQGVATGEYRLISADFAPASFGVSLQAITARPGGGFTALWRERRGGFSELWMRHLDAESTPTGEPIKVADAHPFNSAGGEITYAPDGRGLIAWLDADPDATAGLGPDRIQTRAVFADGTLSPLTRGAALDEDGIQGLKLLTLQDVDGFVVGWRAEDTSTVEVRKITLDGEPVGDISTLAEVGIGNSIESVLAWDLTSGPRGELILVREDLTDTQLSAQRFGPPCGGEILCLGTDQRFRVQVDWQVAGSGEGRGQARDQQTLDTGSFWFFNPENIELVVKVLDGRPLNGHFWVFYGSLSNVEFELEVTDTVTGNRALFVNPAGTQASRGDIQALPSP